MIVREMNIDDIKKVKEIEDQVYKVPWTNTMFLNEIISNKFAYLFVLENNNEIIGYSGVWIVADTATITKVTVSKEYQGKGLGDILIEDLINRVKSVKCAYVSLEVRVSNTKAFNLYKKYAFKQVAVRKKYYNDGEDAYAMVKYFKDGEDYEETYIGN
ncbi:MAG: ribosomal protein S18-alanine N-acetyltransferase [Bacilli bacterium]|nr:ribosomal protein S18-alanine N-acetyltransferase [Bacilli bacterium]